MSTFDLYSFTDPREYLNAFLDEKQKVNPRFSIRAWARLLGYQHPSLLAKVLKGERKISLDLAAKLGSGLKFDEDQQKYFELITLISNATSQTEKNVYLKLLENKFSYLNFQDLSLEYFRLLSDWYHFAILEMIDLKDFKNDPKYISKRLGDRVSPQMAALAIKRLIRLELIFEEKGKLRRNQDALVVGKNLPSEAIRTHHRQMIDLAIEAIDSQDVAERNLTGSTFSIRKKDLKKAYALIAKFHADIQKVLLQKNSGDEVYQLNTQFFKLTNSDEVKS